MRISISGELDESAEDLDDPTNSMNRRNLSNRYPQSGGLSLALLSNPMTASLPEAFAEAAFATAAAAAATSPAAPDGVDTKMLHKKFRRSDPLSADGKPVKKRRIRKNSPTSVADALTKLKSAPASPVGSRCASPFAPSVVDSIKLSSEGEGIASVLASMRNSAVNSRCNSPVNTGAQAGIMVGKGLVLGETMSVGIGGGRGAPPLPMPKKKRSLSLLSEIACPEWQGGGV